MTSETKRKIEHIVPVAFAFLLRYLNTWQALLFAGAGIVYGIFFSKMLVTSAFREHEREKGVSVAKLIYGVMVFILILLFHHTMYIAAGAWAIMSLGDGCSNLFGRLWGKRKLPWNSNKSWVGSLSFVVCGGLGAAVLMWWVDSGHFSAHATQGRIIAPMTWTYILAVAFLAALASAYVESLSLKINDNITVPLTAGLFLYAASLIHWENLCRANSLVVALSVNVLFGLLAYFLKTVSRSGFLCGVILGSVIYLCLGPGGFLVLFTFFTLGSWASKHKYTWKSSHGVAQENKGRRSSKHAIAKGGVGLVMAVMALLTDTPELFAIAFVAAFATATFDTVSSELGQVYGKRPILITTMKTVPAGTDGAISIEGTVLGILSAAFVGAEAYFLRLISLQSIAIVVIAAFAGTTVESFLGATVERRKWVDNEVVNFVNISTGAGTAMLMAKYFYL